MKIVGCDLHTRYQQIAMLDEDTGELVERRLEHASGEAKEFYTQLAGRGCPTFCCTATEGAPSFAYFAKGWER